jgi:hypothetical protein
MAAATWHERRAASSGEVFHRGLKDHHRQAAVAVGGACPSWAWCPGDGPRDRPPAGHWHLSDRPSVRPESRRGGPRALHAAPRRRQHVRIAAAATPPPVAASMCESPPPPPPPPQVHVRLVADGGMLYVAGRELERRCSEGPRCRPPSPEELELLAQDPGSEQDGAPDSSCEPLPGCPWQLLENRLVFPRGAGPEGGDFSEAPYLSTVCVQAACLPARPQQRRRGPRFRHRRRVAGAASTAAAWLARRCGWPKTARAAAAAAAAAAATTWRSSAAWRTRRPGARRAGAAGAARRSSASCAASSARWGMQQGRCMHRRAGAS